jgi:hypothetical protein
MIDIVWSYIWHSQNWWNIFKMYLISFLDIWNGFFSENIEELVQFSKPILKTRSNGFFFNVIFAQHGVNSTYEQYYARYIFNFWRSKYERKSYLNCMVNIFFLSVNTILNFFFPKPFLKFIWNFSDKDNSIFRISCTLGLKIMKQIPLNPSHSRFFQF